MRWKTQYTSGHYTITKVAPKQFFVERFVSADVEPIELGEFTSVIAARKACQADKDAPVVD